MEKSDFFAECSDELKRWKGVTVDPEIEKVNWQTVGLTWAKLHGR
jgi:hypothetical protein